MADNAKTVICCFSGTGNSLKIARDLCPLLGAKLLKIRGSIDMAETAGADCIGIVFPVYIFGLPLIIERFVRQMQVSGKPYIFAVANFGGAPGGAMIQLKERLQERNLQLSVGFGIKMPGNYTPLYGAIPEDKQKEMFADEAQEVKNIAAFVRDRKTGPIVKNNALVNLFLYHGLYRVASPRIPGMDKDFTVDGKCTKCGICSRVCPVQNIRMENGRPVWLHHCEQCLACLQWCPVEAIQFGRKTAGRKRYRHPDIKVEDLTR